MRLKNIKLAGFKSFVDPTNVQLNTNMVAVVGPNGCGKSNIIDAVRWVMGESSAKNLRGESMADVIFNGSNARKAVGQASIELVFDNSDGTLKGEYGAFSEISIKRKVTRDGQSQYFINNTKCRRRDITDIFLGTGLGPRSYAIIEQGMISRLIESKPEELRVFVEEAAGISKYKERRRETETRIRHTRENLERLTDLRDELERLLNKLRRQASAAEKYKTYKEEERLLKAQTSALQWQEIHDQSKDRRQAIAEDEIALEAAIAEQRAVEAGVEELREAHVEKTDSVNEIQAGYYRVGAEIARIEQSVEHGEQRARQIACDLEETRASAQEANKHLHDDNQKLSEWREEFESISPHHEELAQSSSASSQALENAESAMQDWQQRWDEFNSKAAEPQKNAEIQRARIDQVEESLTGLSGRYDRLRAEISDLEAQDHNAELNQQRELLAQTQQLLEQLQRELNDRAATLNAKRDERREISDQIDTARSELQQQKGRFASLEALQKAAQQDGQATANKWLETHSLSNQPRLLDSLKVMVGWETAVETALGGNVQAVAIPDLESITGLIDTLSDADLNFVETSGVALSAGNNALGLQLLETKVESGNIGALLNGVYAANNFEEALAVRSKLSGTDSIVTRDGVWLGRDWLRVLRSQGESSGVIERQQQLDGLGNAIESRQAEVDGLLTKLEAVEQAIADAESEKERVQQAKGEQQNALGGAQSEIKALENTIAQVATRLSKTRDEVGRVELTQKQQREALSDARVQLDTAIASMQEVEEQREVLLLERDKVRDTLTVSREAARADREALQAVAVRAEGLNAKIQSVQETLVRLERQSEQLRERELALVANAEEVNGPLPELRKDLEVRLGERLQVEERLSDARKALDDVDQQVRQLEQRRHELDGKTQDIRARLEQTRIASQEMAVRAKTIEEQLVEHGFQLQEVVAELPDDAALKAYQDLLRDVTVRIERLGAINLASIEELATESERKKYLDAQNEELESALATLEDAIHKIDKETRHLFKQTFDSLNSSLQELFPKVFGGGTAYLELTGEDLLDTGIAIMARPPGKRNSTIHLLSGGEKALTAIALVFSIFQLNPAPFCMLDEVDAPLDDANTGRYARMIREMSDRVQFIFITHNKITMEMADHLMGVTMHEPGCSRLVSVDIDEAVELATA